jgi:hypothetical protein
MLIPPLPALALNAGHPWLALALESAFFNHLAQKLEIVIEKRLTSCKAFAYE